jgi:hypothetical protein
MIWLSLLFNFAGLSAFALGTDVHHRAIFDQKPASARAQKLKAGGTLLLSLSLALAIATAGFGVGFVEWIAGLAACGFALALLLSSRNS